MTGPEGSFWDGVNATGDNFDITGSSICGLFVVVGIASVILHRPPTASGTYRTHMSAEELLTSSMMLI
jgi:hypothetical protein